jgi:ribosome-binding factor A
MYELLEDFLKNDDIRNLGDVEVISFAEDGHKCKVYYKDLDDDYDYDTTVNLWDVLAYVHKKNKK